MRFQWLGGLLILYVLFQFLKKKSNPIQSSLNPRNVSGGSFLYDKVFQLVGREEGFNPVAVRDGTDRNGNPLYTIGFGHQIQPNERELMTKRITEIEAKVIYDTDIQKIVSDMESNIKVSINENQFLALISLRYNIGGPQFNSSTLLRKLNANDYTGAADEFAKWRLSDGRINNVLVARRAREKSLFLNPV